MTGWNAGYVHELDYSMGFYRELSPHLLDFSAVLSGFRPSRAEGAFTYFELGCGHGLSAIVNAAAAPEGRSYANDFNPTHIATARRIAASAGLDNIEFLEDSFEDLLSRELPEFDYITLHGIWSWVSDANRGFILDFIRQKLKPGGICYVSYNCLPGWAPFSPFRKLVREMGQVFQAQPIDAQLDSAFGFIKRFQAVSPSYLKSVVGFSERAEKIMGMGKKYLAHEYLNDNWDLFYHCDVARRMGDAKLSFVGSAHLADHVDALNLSAEQISMLQEVTDSALRETLRDYCVHQQFRRDVFMKGSPRLTPAERQSILSGTPIVLTVARSEMVLKINVPVGEVGLQADVYNPIADVLAEKPASITQLLSDSRTSPLGYEKLYQALLVLIGTGQANVALSEQKRKALRSRISKLNDSILKQSVQAEEVQYLVSPVTGIAHPADRITQLMLLAHRQNRKDMAEAVWSVLSAQGQRLVRDGKVLNTPEENLAELKARAEAFRIKTLPLLTYLGIA